MFKKPSVSSKDPQSSTLERISHLPSRTERSSKTCHGSRNSASLLIQTIRLSFRLVSNSTTGSCSASTLHPPPTITQEVTLPRRQLPQPLQPQLLPLVPVLPLIPLTRAAPMIQTRVIHGPASLSLLIPSWLNRILEAPTVES